MAVYLRDILSNPSSSRIFTTSRTSGTLRIYQSLFNDEDSINLEKMLDEQKSYLFYKNSSSDYINCLDDQVKLPYIILGSNSYYVIKLEETYRRLFISDENGIVAKPMYVYFIAYKCDEHYCEIRTPIIKFLKDIDADEKLNENTWNDILQGRLKSAGGNKIIELNY